MTVLVVHLADVPPENQDAGDGWRISDFRLPYSGRDGLPFTVFCGRFRPGSQHSVHRHDDSEEMCIYLAGEGLVGTGEDRYTVRTGHARLMPRGVPHYFHNAGTTDVAEVFGLYPAADSVAATGYAFLGVPADDDLARSRAAHGPFTYPVVREADRPLRSSWHGATLRPLLSTDGPPPAASFAAHLDPGGSREPHTTADADLVYRVRGGQAEVSWNDSTATLTRDDLWLVPRGTTSGFRSVGPEPLHLYGFAIGTRDPFRTP